MEWKIGRILSLSALVAAALLRVGLAQEPTPSDEGPAAGFKGKTVELKDKGEFAVLLNFAAGQSYSATTNGTKETDVHLFVYDSSKKEIGKDVSPGPKCDVTFTTATAGKYTFVVKNSNGPNSVTLEVKSVP